MSTVFSASRLPKDPGPAGWHDILDPAPLYPEAEGELSTDWLVIGGGFAGLSAVKRLLELRGGDQIMLLEAGRIGTGPAGRNSGFMIDLPHELGADGYAASQEVDKKQITLNRHAQDFALQAADEYEMPAEAVQKIGRVNGAVNARGQHHNDEYAAHLAGLGESFTRLSADEMAEMTGSDYYRSGLFMPGAVLLQPALYIRALAQGVARQASQPIQLFERSPALQFEKQADSWLVKTPKATIKAKTIFMAVNGHAESFGFYQNRLMHVFTYASMSAPLDNEQQKRLGGLDNWGIDPKMEVSDARVAAYGRDQDKAFYARFPQLSDVKMAYRWSGRLCLSRNSVPAFGALDDNLYSACCQNGLGTAKGTLSGIGAVELALRSNSPIVQDLLSYDQPVKLPPKPLASIGANLVLKWREFKAGREI